MKKVKLSVLDLAVVTQGGNAASAIKRTVQAARHAEELGYERIWMAEHHNMEHIASSATSVLIGHVGGQTSDIRIGSGGIMLPNHSPLAIAEQFGTLDALYPGRVDLGLGRAPGTDQNTAMALRRNAMHSVYDFPQDIRALQRYFSSDNSKAAVRAFPGEGAEVPIWVLGSSTDSAYLSAEMGLPYAFAAHFAPSQFRTAADIYRKRFQPSEALENPYMMACVNVIAADTDAEAHKLATSMYRMFLGIITNTRMPLQPPVDSMEPYWTPEIKAHIEQMTACTFIGSKETIAKELGDFIAETQVDELMIAANIYDGQARLKSYTLAAEALESTDQLIRRKNS